MNIQDIKAAMKQFSDFYGCNLLELSEVDKANTKEDLLQIIETHRSHMESMLCDANAHLDDFIKKIGLNELYL